MEVAGKNPVNVVQELMAIHANRKEAYEKMAPKANDESLRKTMQHHIAQTDRFIASLLNELSQFGDGVAGDVDMENAFNNTWKANMQGVKTFNNSQLGKLVNELERLLIGEYRRYAALYLEMPASTKELIDNQKNELMQGAAAT